MKTITLEEAQLLFDLGVGVSAARKTNPDQWWLVHNTVDFRPGRLYGDGAFLWGVEEDETDHS